jgi:hypothetical protein
MITLQNRPDSKEVADFIAELNQKPHHHVGYCGEQTEEILHTLLNDFSDLPLEASLIVTYEDERMIGVLGIDFEEESGEGELWGPFVQHEQWGKVARLMWEGLHIQASNHLNKVNGFYNVKNQNAHEFMEWLVAEKQNRHAILKIAQDDYSSGVETQECYELTESFYKDFQRLHDETFRDTYFIR